MQKNLMNRFLVTTPGLSATRWLCFALVSRKDVFVSHGKHPLDSVIRGDFIKEKGSGDIESFTLGNKMRDFYEQKTLEEIFTEFQNIMPQARVYGNVHAFTIETLMSKIRSERELRGIKILNILRHPVNYLESHFHLVKSAELYPELYQHYEQTMLNQACAQYPELALFDDVPKPEFTAFVVSCLSVCNLANDFKFTRFQHVRMEDITTDVNALHRFCEELTGLTYSIKDLENIIAQGPINCHKKHFLNKPLEIYESWDTWQQDIVHMMLPASVLDKLAERGYDVSMLCLENNHSGVALKEERQDRDKDIIGSVSAAEDQISRMFATGNYTGVVLADDKGRWETYAAMGLIGKTSEAITGLERFQNEQARFYSGVASWIDGDEATAIAVLEKMNIPHAQNLLALIHKPQIQVLAQLPWVRQGSSDFLSYLNYDRKFKVRNISFDSQQLPNEPYADISKFVDRNNPPDFFICKMVEWHLIPPDIQKLTCPIIGHTADYDLHIQGVYPWLQVFDEMVVTDHTEWDDVRRLVAVPVATFPKSFGVPTELPEISFDKRPIDVFFSGSVMHPYHPDKARLLHESLLLPDKMNVWYMDGFTYFNVYYTILAQSKATITYIRHPGAMPTRGLDALCMGCAVVVQKGNSLTLFAGEEEGVLTYDSEKGNLNAALDWIVREWEDFEPCVRRGSEIIRKEFALPKVVSQYLRFLTFLAAKPREQRKLLSPETLIQKRMIISKGWLPGPPQLMHTIQEQNFARLVQTAQYEQKPTTVIDIARELVLEYAGIEAHRMRQPDYPPPDRAIITRAIAIMQEGLSIFPSSLVLRFNLIRSALHYGSPEEVSQVLKLARQTLTSSADGWEVRVDEDVFPWDFFSSFFNYRSYFDLLTEHLMEKTEVETILVRLILSSLHYYLGFYENGIAHFQQAVELDPDFPFYRLQLARGLIERGNSPDYEYAGNLLCGLAENSILFKEAYELLTQLKQRNLFNSPRYLELVQKIRKVAKSDRLTKDSGIIIANADWRRHSLKPALSSNLDEDQFSSGQMSVKEGDMEIASEQDRVKSKAFMFKGEAENVTIMIPTLNRSAFLIRGLNYYDKVGFKGWICIADSSNTRHSKKIMSFIHKLKDRLNIVYAYFPKPHFKIQMCFKKMVELAPTPYVVYSGDDDILIPSSLTQCAEFLEDHPEYVAAHGLRIAYKLIDGSECGEIGDLYYVQQHEWDSAKASERWTKYVRHPISTQYYVHRKEIWQKMYQDAGSVPSFYLGEEFLPCSLTAILGKVKQLECLSTLFQIQDHDRFAGWFFELMIQPDWFRSVQGVRQSIVEALMRQERINESIAREIFDREFWYHIISVLFFQYRQVYGGIPEKPIDNNFNLNHSEQNIYAFIMSPNWFELVESIRGEQINKLLTQKDMEVSDAKNIFDRNLWEYLMWLLYQQYQQKYTDENIHAQLHATQNNVYKYQELLSLKALLKSTSPFHDDFIPAFQMITQKSDLRNKAIV